MPSLVDRIVTDSEVCFGKPCVRDTRITVRTVLDLLDANIPEREILTDWYPELTHEDIEACLAYARDYPQSIQPLEPNLRPSSHERQLSPSSTISVQSKR